MASRHFVASPLEFVGVLRTTVREGDPALAAVRNKKEMLLAWMATSTPLPPEGEAIGLLLRMLYLLHK